MNTTLTYTSSQNQLVPPFAQYTLSLQKSERHTVASGLVGLVAGSGTRGDQNRRRLGRQVVRRSGVSRDRRPRLKYSARRRVALLLILARVVVDRHIHAVVQTPERHQAVRLLDRHALHVLGTAIRVRRRREK